MIAGDPQRWETLSVDETATAELRASIHMPHDDADGYRAQDAHECWWATND